MFDKQGKLANPPKPKPQKEGDTDAQPGDPTNIDDLFGK